MNVLAPKLSAAERREESQARAGSGALDIVDILAGSSDGIDFAFLEIRSGMASVRLSRLLKMLLQEKWVRQDAGTGKFLIGPRLMMLGLHLRSQSSEADVVLPSVEQLAEATGHSACYARLEGDFFCILAKKEMGDSFHFYDAFQKNTDFIDNGMGSFLLAFEGRSTVEYIHQKIFNEKVGPQRWELLNRIRDDHFFISHEGVVTRVMAAVSRRTTEKPRGVLSIAALGLAPADVDSHLALVQEIAREAGARLALTYMQE